MSEKPKQCADCRNGEHDNYDDNVKLVVVRDPETNKILKRAYECYEHRCMYIMDGYQVYHNGIDLTERE